MRLQKLFIGTFLVGGLWLEAQSLATQKMVEKSQALAFIPNRGQWHPDALFLARLGGIDCWIARDGLVLDFFQFKDQEPQVPEAFPVPEPLPDKLGRDHQPQVRYGHVVRLRLLGANIHAEPAGLHQLPGFFNYFIGNDPSRHAAHVPRFAEVRLSDVYPGIDFRYYFDGGQPRFDFIVQPGADPSQIRFSMEGTEAVYVKEGQTLAFRTRFGEAVLTKLYAYQGERPVESRFVAKGGTYRIAVGAYDPTQPLIIDPLVWSTFLGGSGNGYDYGYDIAIDANGSAYITGYTGNTNFPTTSGAYDQSLHGYRDAFVTKLSSNGDSLTYSTFLGGNDYEEGYAIAIDASGSAYITGYTQSSDFPTTPSAYDTSYNGGDKDVFVTKLSPDGSSLTYATFLGGSSDDVGMAITVDNSGSAYITGYTASYDFPETSGAYDISYNGGAEDVFVTKLSPDGSSVAYSTFLGGSTSERGSDIVVDASGNAYITGYAYFSYSANFPVTSSAYDQSHNGAQDVFVTKLSPDGSSLTYSTFLGGGSSDYGIAIAIDASGSAYITGTTFASGFPTTSGAYDQSYNGGYGDAFVTKLSPDGSTLAYCTFLGGSTSSARDEGRSIAVDASGCAYITGFTESSDFPTTPNAYDTLYNGPDVFISKLSPDGSTLSYSTFLGGGSSDESYGIAIDNSGSAYITGYTNSYDFPTTPGAYNQSYNGFGNTDIFVTKLSIGQTTPIAIPHSPTLVLHPNPTRGAFTIETPTGGTFELLNTQGQRLRTYTLPAGSHTLHETLPAGTYLLHETRSGATSKLLIQP
ncbi:MAG: SBBP repeat-containing protein [Bacteroidia bacterium]|nr:SBBP repeat-containing protein [Bacteroidia bacterium]